MRRAIVSVGLLVSATLGAQTLQSGQSAVPAGGRGGRGAQPGLEPRIVLFEARPATVRPGQPVQLVWQTENPSGVSIEPEVGAVTARGSKQVTPTATTRYTLTMKGGPTRTVTVVVEGTAPSPSSAATAGVGRVGFLRMPDGKPDLSGVYGSAGLPQGTTPPSWRVRTITALMPSSVNRYVRVSPFGPGPGVYFDFDTSRRH